MEGTHVVNDVFFTDCRVPVGATSSASRSDAWQQLMRGLRSSG